MGIPSIPPPETSRETPEKFRQKLQYMYIDLGNRGVWRSTMAPPFYKIAWAMGFQLVPPLFAKFRQLAAFQGTTWGVSWALLMFASYGGDFDLDMLFKAGSYGGVFFGLCMATFFRVRAKMLNLPLWDDYC